METNADPNAAPPSTDGAQSTDSSWKGRVRDAAIGALVLLIGAVAAYVLDFVSFHKPSAEHARAVATTTTSVTAGAGAATAAASVRLDIRPPGGPVDQCAFIEGTGSAPPGMGIWVAEHAVGDQGFYGLAQVEVEAPDQWHVNIDLGPSGTTFEVFALVLGPEATLLLNNLDVDGDGVPYFKNLPGRERVSRRVTRKPGADAPC